MLVKSGMISYASVPRTILSSSPILASISVVDTSAVELRKGGNESSRGRLQKVMHREQHEYLEAAERDCQSAISISEIGHLVRTCRPAERPIIPVDGILKLCQVAWIQYS